MNATERELSTYSPPVALSARSARYAGARSGARSAAVGMWVTRSHIADVGCLFPPLALFFPRYGERVTNMDERIADENLLGYIDDLTMGYIGQVEELENAIGALMLGRKVGWRPLFLLHSPQSIRKYQKILGVNFQVQLDPVGPKADRLVAWRIAQTVSNFWKLVKGEVPNVRQQNWKFSE